jgi:phage terminase large subunit-like protein
VSSPEQRLAALSEQDRRRVLGGLTPLELAGLLTSWRYQARAEQWEATTAPDHIVLYGAGRGAGKTRTGSEWVRHRIENNTTGRPLLFSLVARTAADCRDVMVQGPSGLMSVFPAHQTPRYIPSARRVEFYDGSSALMFSSEEPSQLRGPQSHYSWADELGAWDHRADDVGLTAWDNLKIATRLGSDPQVFVSTTPKRSGPLPELYKRAAAGRGVRLLTASTYDNVHLSPTYLETMEDLYGGTRLGAQELFATLLADIEGALWQQEMLDSLRSQPGEAGRLPLRVVGVDPSVAENPRDECGIVVVGATAETAPAKRQAYVLADRSLHGPPGVWARAVVDAAREFDAPVVVEINQGGALVTEAIHALDPRIRVRGVHAKKGKALRAEPVQMAYEQERVSHVGHLPLLEAQMTSWVPGETAKSPDRVDALVYAVASLLLPSSVGLGLGPATVRRAQGRIPTASPAQAAGIRRLPARVGAW